MSKYTKYRLYQKYETRGSQEAIPCYPSLFSIDGDGTMPLVIVEEDSRECGYTGETQPIYRWYTLPIETYYVCDACQDAQYRWVNIPIAEDWECVGTTKYYKQKKQVSVDGAVTWVDVTPPEYQRGSVYEYSSQGCGYRTRTTTGSPYCVQYDKYVNVYTETSSDGGSTWITASTTPTLVEHNSAYCGYIEPQYRTTSGTPYCSGYDKYVPVYSQVSYDGGSTWQTTATTQTLVEHNSQDCGYVPPTGYSNQYLTLVAKGSGAFMKVGNSDTFQYSKDNGLSWTNATSATTITVNNGDRVMFKGTLTPSYGVGKFSANTTFEVEGNPMSLLYGDNFIGQTSLSGKTNAFINMFSGCTTLSSIDNLKLVATTLAKDCYMWMFRGCTSLTSVPSGLLPATSLSSASGCYQYMFYGCTSLTSIPSGFLPATTLASSCYHRMFEDCTSLASIPSGLLPATTMQIACYSGMFSGCTSLTSVPSNLLPATSLSAATGCYKNMFCDCSSLASIPSGFLPATTLVSQCYESMFNGCTSLTSVPSNLLPATSLTYADDCYAAMFSVCTSLTTPPQLPSTSLGRFSYATMFYGCTSLTTAPELPASQLREYCYQYMFNGCSSLNYIKCLATNISATNCTTNWVDGVSSSGTFVKASSTNWGSCDVSKIPCNWTVQNA